MSEKIYIEFNNPIYLLRNTQSMFIYSQYWSVALKNLMNELLPQIYNSALNAYEASTIDYEYLVKRCGELNIEIELFKPNEPNKIEEQAQCEFKYKTKPYKHQEECVKFGMDVNRFLLGDEMGLGKALSLDTKVYTPNGFKQIIDIHNGDYVFTEKGVPCKVVAEYYNEDVNMYNVGFSDGTHIKCCEDHLWQINTQHGKKVVPTKWFTQQDHYGKVRAKHLVGKHSITNYWIDRCTPIMFEHKKVEIHPYIIGCLLGDGCLCSTSISICNNDKELLDRVSNLLPSGYVLHSSPAMNDNTYTIKSSNTTHTNLVVKSLKSLGLYGTTSHTKFVPNEYKFTDINSRFDIVRGLLDTDGYATKDNMVIYTTVSKQLAMDMKFLIESLGGIISLKTKIGKYNGKQTSLTYNLTIKFDNPQDLFYLSRKRNLLHQRKFKPKRAITSVTYIGKSDAKCITVDNPTGLYVIENFIVTHNTKEIIDLATLKKFSLGYKHCLIVCCVNGLKWNWQDEIGIHSDEKCHIIGSRINSKNKEVIKGKTAKLEDLQKIADGEFDDTYFFITNVETLRDKAISDKLSDLCKNKIINMIAVDECHKCNSPTAQQTKGLLKLTTDSMIAMTGSPIMNNPLDLYVPLNWLGYERHRYDEFVNHFCRKGKFNSITGFKNMEQIQNSLKIMMLRRLKKDVLDLPEKIYTNEYVEMSQQQEKIYNEVLNDLREQVDLIARSNNPLANLIRLRQATGHTSIVSSSVACSSKFDRCLELVSDFVKDGHKIIIFSNWKQMIEILHSALLSYNPAVITGDTKDRQEEKRRFMEDDDCKVILGTIGACGTGLTLTAADIVIFYDEPWTTANKVQAEDRAHRIGAKNNVQIITLLTKNTIDERIHTIVEKKGIISENLIDNLDCVQITQLLNFLLN